MKDFYITSKKFFTNADSITVLRKEDYWEDKILIDHNVNHDFHIFWDPKDVLCIKGLILNAETIKIWIILNAAGFTSITSFLSAAYRSNIALELYKRSMNKKIELVLVIP